MILIVSNITKHTPNVIAIERERKERERERERERDDLFITAQCNQTNTSLVSCRSLLTHTTYTCTYDCAS